MRDPLYHADEFVTRAPQRLQFLEERGFRHVAELDDARDPLGAVHYLGQNIGFCFYFDVRDQFVGLEIVECHRGELIPRKEGGRSLDFIYYPRKKEFSNQPIQRNKSKKKEIRSLDNMIDIQASLLQQHGEALLADPPLSDLQHLPWE